MEQYKKPISPSEWQELQRDCHPFPAYVDYIQGQPTEYERTLPPPVPLQPFGSRGLWGPAVPPANFVGPYPSPPQSISGSPYTGSPQSIFEDSFVHPYPSMASVPPMFPLGPPLAPPSQLEAQPPHQPDLTAGPQHAFERDEFLKPQYGWLPEHALPQINAHIGQLHDTADNKDLPAEQRAAAAQTLIQITHSVETQRKQFHYNILPRIWDALKIREQMPNTQKSTMAAVFLQKMAQQYQGNRWQYITNMLSAMNKKSAEGKVPLEAIPGWLEHWLESEAQKDASRNAMAPGGEATQSQGESSPLPEWKGY
ncbi:hypothetical protein N0V90_004420 [Kalmusia sp. IMI 367209]|nr:hypothetical protein N0V90_004420 [Kalmusia sp. IMI 367209]